MSDSTKSSPTLPSPALPRLPPRSPDTNKGDYGRALLIGGSRGMAGSISLSGMAALRGGAGLVTLAVPRSCQATVSGFEPSYMTIGLPEDSDCCLALLALDELIEPLKAATVIACGPGLGRSAELRAIVPQLYQSLKQPCVFDADGLNALAALPNGLPTAKGPRILTPHPGEFARLIHRQRIAEEERQPLAIEFAARHNVVLLLKGHRTIITDGRQLAINTTGNPGMATGGCGDVLTGLITALVGQGLSPFAAAQLGAHVHGLAGDLAAAELGETSLIASDLLRLLAPGFLSAPQ